MNLIDATIMFVKDEIPLSDKKRNQLLQQLYSYRFTKSVVWHEATISVCFGQKRSEILLLSQPKIAYGDILTISNRNYFTAKITSKFFTHQETSLQKDSFLQVLDLTE